MDTILILGAGKSSVYLIDYLLETAKTKNRKIVVGDVSLEIASQKLKGHQFGEAVVIDLDDVENRKSLIKRSDVVISMLPAFLHPIIGKDCLELGKHFF